MVVVGAFGGWLNYLHSFDTVNDSQVDKHLKTKYVFLGIGSSILVPAFLKMIASDLIKATTPYDNINYLIFAGFCLVAAIFSRRFITSIGEKILEAAKKAEISAKENKKEIESTKLELSTTQDRIEDVKASVTLKTVDVKNISEPAENSTKQLLDLVNSFIQKTSIADYRERLRTKAEIGRKMGQIIVSQNLPKEELFNNHKEEGMYLALAYAVDLKPNDDGVTLINRISLHATQLYTKYVILLAYRTLCSSGFVKKSQAKEIARIVESFRPGADKPLKRHIDDTLNVLRFIESDI
jgi:hypothetical protein